MDNFVLQQALEWIVDFIIGTNPEEVIRYVDKIRAENPGIDRRKIAEIIVNEQSVNNGLLGAGIGLFSLMPFPATIPVDIVKAWKIQAFAISCIAYVYGHTPKTTDLKTDIFLVLSNGSLEELKTVVISEAINAAPKNALTVVDALKITAVEVAAKQAPKYASKAIAKDAVKVVVKQGMKGLPKELAKAIWKVAGRKAIEKALQKSMSAAIPAIGAVVGGSIDWFTTQAIGNLAIEYYENSGPEWVDRVLGLSEEKAIA